MVTEALSEAWSEPGRPATSERGLTETLRSLRAARTALDDLEHGLTQARPVQRRVRRYTGSPQRKRGT